MKKIMLLTIACLYTMDCPVGQECVVDPSGHGVCQAAAYKPAGEKVNWCTFNFDCEGGKVCVKKKLSDYGRCE
jgi:hypothetical protein